MCVFCCSNLKGDSRCGVCGINKHHDGHDSFEFCGRRIAHPQIPLPRAFDVLGAAFHRQAPFGAQSHLAQTTTDLRRARFAASTENWRARTAQDARCHFLLSLRYFVAATNSADKQAATLLSHCTMVTHYQRRVVLFQSRVVLPFFEHFIEFSSKSFATENSFPLSLFHSSSSL